MAEPNGRGGIDDAAEKSLRLRFAAWAEGGRRREIHDVAVAAAVLSLLAGVPEYLALGAVPAFFVQLALRTGFSLGCWVLAARAYDQPIRRLETAAVMLCLLAIGTWVAGVAVRPAEPFTCHVIGFLGMVVAVALCPAPPAAMLACQAVLAVAFAAVAPPASPRDIVTTALVATLIGGAVVHLKVLNGRLQRLGIVQIENQFDAEERTRRAETAKAVFFAQMSHELRTPLNAIIGFSEMIEAEANGARRPDRLSDYARFVAGSGAQLSRLVDTLLDLARIEREVDTIEKAPIAPTPLIETVLLVLGPQAQAEGITLTLDARAAPPRINASATALRHAVALLVTDAMRHTPRRGAIAVVLAGAGTSDVRLTVEGEGAGGFAIERGTSRELTVLRQIAAAHGGDATIEPAGNGRTRVTLRWPIDMPA